MGSSLESNSTLFARGEGNLHFLMQPLPAFAVEKDWKQGEPTFPPLPSCGWRQRLRVLIQVQFFGLQPGVALPSAAAYLCWRIGALLAHLGSLGFDPVGGSVGQAAPFGTEDPSSVAFPTGVCPPVGGRECGFITSFIFAREIENHERCIWQSGCPS